MNEYEFYCLKEAIEDVYENVFVENSDLFKDFFMQLELFARTSYSKILPGKQFSTYWNKIGKNKYDGKIKDKTFYTAYFTIEFTGIIGKVNDFENKPKTAIVEIDWYRPQAYLSNHTAQMLRDFQKKTRSVVLDTRYNDSKNI